MPRKLLYQQTGTLIANMIRQSISCVLLLVIILAAYWQLLPSENFFGGGYLSLLSTAPATPAHEIMTVLPEAVHDRPAAVLAVKMLHQLFGLAPSRINVVMLLLHAVSAVLLCVSIGRLFSLQDSAPLFTLLAFVSAALFSVSDAASSALQGADGLSAIIAVFFLNLSLSLFLSPRTGFQAFDGVLVFLFYFVAARSFELVLPFPFLLLLVGQIQEFPSSPDNDFSCYRRRLSWAVFSLMVLLGVFEAVAATNGRYGGHSSSTINSGYTLQWFAALLPSIILRAFLRTGVTAPRLFRAFVACVAVLSLWQASRCFTTAATTIALRAGEERRTAWLSLSGLRAPEKGSTIAITNIPRANVAQNIFFEGPGDAMRAYWRVRDLHIRLVLGHRASCHWKHFSDTSIVDYHDGLLRQLR